MRLGKEIFLLCHKATGIFYHKENDAVLICGIPTDNQLDGMTEFDELIIEVTDEEVESWAILYTFSTQEFFKITMKLGKVMGNESNSVRLGGIR